MKQTTLDRRDKRRAKKIIADVLDMHCAWDDEQLKDAIPAIAAALKRERDETGMSAVNWFLFSERGTKESTKRAIAQKYCKRKHLTERGKA